MFLQRSALVAARRAVAAPVAMRTFTSSLVARKSDKAVAPPPLPKDRTFKTIDEIKTDADLLPPGALPGTVPTDLEQATGLERFEILGKMQGIDVFDMRPLDASRRGTMKDPIMVNSFGDEQYCGCTGFPAGDHVVRWLTISRDRPIERCNECGNVYKMNYVGPPDDPHAHDHGHGHADTDGSHNYEEEPKTFADYIRPEYRYR